MTTASRLEQLAGQCEAASGADRDLDALIACAIGDLSKHPKWVQRWQGALTPYPGKPGYVAHVSGVWWSSAKVTASLDAAMSLVPEPDDDPGEKFRLEAYNDPGVLPEHVRASAWVPGAPRVYAATPALALTAASLRSRASLLRTQGESNG